MSRIVNPISDIFVRYLLGSEENTNLLLDFINGILMDSGFKPAVKIKILNPFNLKSFINDKESILDVKAEDADKRIFDVEIQVIGNSQYIKRSLYYWAKNYHSQLKTSEDYKKLEPVICINILDFIIFKDLKSPHSCFLPTEKDEPEYVLTDDFQIHYFELPKMMDKNRKEINERLEKWAVYFKKEGLEEEENNMKILLNNDTIMEQAHKTYENFSANDELLEVYEARSKRLHDEATRLSDAREEGIQKGLEKGLEKGIQKGIQKGIEKGQLEKALEAAKVLKNANVAIEIISKSTGLTEKEILEL